MSDFHGTTIVCVRRNGRVAIGGDGQVTLGNQVMKGNARKVRRLHEGKVLAGFAGGAADAFTLFEFFEAKLQKHGNLMRAAIELAKDWRTDRMLRRLEALLIVADAHNSLLISGTEDDSPNRFMTSTEPRSCRSTVPAVNPAVAVGPLIVLTPTRPHARAPSAAPRVTMLMIPKNALVP